MVPSKSRSRTATTSQVRDRSGSLQELSNTNSRSVAASLQEKKPQVNGFRLFSKQSSPNLSSKATATENLDGSGSDRMLRLDELRGLVTPCPFVKPLEHKLQARQEPSTLRRTVLNLNPEQGVSAITIARRRGETIKKLTGRASDEDLVNIHEEGMQSSGFFEVLASSPRRPSTIKMGEIDHVARILAPDPSFASMWSYYIQCYAKGHFNIIDPPDPPPLGPNFEYFPAVKPPNEDQRAALSREYDILWPAWTKDKSGALLRAAMGKFDTPYASFSIFDDSNELFKAENGFDQPEIGREMSIAAHILYTNEVLVLLDTHKDWRFVRNPLVAGTPGIRFFAGAPLLSPEGLVMGVFAVWSKEPRAFFSPDDRRELAEFGALVMTDLTLQVTRLSDPDLQVIPRTQRDELIHQFREYNPEASSTDMDGAANFEPVFMPPALRYHRPASPPLSKFYTGSHQVPKNSYIPSHTPPQSLENKAVGLILERETRRFSEEVEKCLNPDSSSQGITLLPSLEDIQSSSSRPFSTSDLTSFYPLPPNTPEHTLVDHELSHQPIFDLDQFPSVPDLSGFGDSQDFSTSSDIRQRSAPAGAGILGKNNTFLLSATNTSTEYSHGGSERTSEDNTSLSVLSDSPCRRENGSPIIFDRQVGHERQSGKISSRSATPSQYVGPSTTVEKFINTRGSAMSIRRSDTTATICDRISPSWESSEAAKQAALACSSFAQKLGYDLIYVAEIKPTRPGGSDEDLLKPGGMTKRILVAYGLTQPLDLSSETHLRILRCRGSEHWVNDGASDTQQHYQHGCLVSILADKRIPRSKRDSGLVMGAFCWSRSIENSVSAKEEVSRLIEFSKSLRGLLLKKPERKSIKRSMTEPSSPTTNPYLANEATEVQFDDDLHQVSKYSFDSRHTRRFM